MKPWLEDVWDLLLFCLAAVGMLCGTALAAAFLIWLVLAILGG